MSSTTTGWLTPHIQRLRTWFAPSALASLAATVVVLAADDVTGPQGKLLWALIAAWLGCAAASLHAQARGWSLVAGLAFQFAAGGAAAALVLLDKRVGLFPPPYFLGLLVAIVAAPLPALRDPEAYWAWCEKLALAAALAGAAALIGMATAAGTLWSANHLFGLGAWLNRREFIWPAAIFLCAVGPIALLAVLPSPAPGSLEAGARDFVRRAVSILAAWALTPFVLIYSALLWLYAGKIALAGALPDGQIGWMVGLFGFTALGSVLLIFPQRASGPRRVRLLWRAWPHLLVAPFVLLALALYERIAAFGLTPGRYMAVLLALLCALNALVAFMRRDAVVRFVPAAAALGFVLAGFGPWSAIGASVTTQKAALRTILEKNGLIRDGRIATGGTPLRLPDREYRRWRSALDFLQQNGALAQAAPEAGAEPFGKLAALVADPVKKPVYIGLSSSADWAAPAEMRSHRLVGVFSIAGGAKKPFPVGDAVIEQADGRLTIRIGGGAPAIFDYARIRDSAGKDGKLPDAPLLRPTDGAQDVVLYLDGFTMGTNTDGSPAPTWLRAFVFARRTD